MSGIEIVELIQIVEKRRPHRDLAYLHSPNVAIATLFYNNWSNWIIQETRDLLQIIEIIKRLGNPALLLVLKPLETRLTEIQEKCGRNLSQMKKISKGTSGAKTEADRFQTLRLAMDKVELIILELYTMRRILEAIVNTYICSSNPPENPDMPSQSYIH